MLRFSLGLTSSGSCDIMIRQILGGLKSTEERERRAVMDEKKETWVSWLELF